MHADVSYTVVGLLGRGGMAVIELAVDGAGRQVARKRVALAGSAREIDLARQRIRREAEILASLRHPGIVPLLGVEDDGADVVLVMPRMAGSLADRVAIEGPLEPVQVTIMARILLDALATAHRQGVVHRDIKPANILFDRAGYPALADFGVAMNREFTPGLTDAGMVIGTPGYLSPEQARGERATPASDVFALGATLAFALTGRGPYGDGDPLALMIRAGRGEVASLPRTIPGHLRRMVQAMLDPRPERRPSAAAALGGSSGTSMQPPAPRRRARRRSILAWWGAAAVAMAAVVAVALVATNGAGRHRLAPTAAARTPPVTAAACTPLPYQPCGQAPAPNTDGRSCLPGYADYDNQASNGCEAQSDYRSDIVLSSRTPVTANLVPADAVDTFRTYVSDDAWTFCLGSVHVTLVAPTGVTDRVEVSRNGKVIASATSADGRPATASAGEPSCFSDNSGWLSVSVSSVSGQTAADFRLTRGGSW
jgi:tRNA A-37 threonylcarbamoyl transferase component Bud32